MYKVLITDDEQIVIDSLSFILNKNFAGQVQIFTALSGTEALKIATQEDIDIIFMDINMPGMNGLEAVNCIIQIKSETVIIILSAFDRFQYAQEAIDLGAYKYITKPVNRNVVIQTVRGAMNIIDKKRGKSEDDEALHKKLDLLLPMVESDFIYSCAFSNDKIIDLQTYLDYFNIQENYWCFLCIEVPNVNISNQLTIYNKVRDILNGQQRCLIGSFMGNRLAVFFPISNYTENEIDDNRINNQIKNLYTILSVKLSSKIRIGVSKIESEKTKTTISYNEALSALNKTSLDGGIYFTEKTETKVNEIMSTSKCLEQIFTRLRIGDAGSINSLINQYMNSLLESNTSIERIKNALFELLVNARNITTEINETYTNEAFDNAFSVLSKEDNTDNLKAFVQKRLLECITVISDVRSQNENPIIKKVCAFITIHISENLSLEEIAKSVNVSPFYLSKLFKEKKGETLINYITEARIDKAKQYLVNSDLSIKEISASVGYNDQNYFSKLFKYKFNLSPTEYRDLNK